MQDDASDSLKRVIAPPAHPIPMVPPLTNPKALLSAGVFLFNGVSYVNLIIVLIFFNYVE